MWKLWKFNGSKSNYIERKELCLLDTVSNKDQNACNSYRIKAEDLETAVLGILKNHTRVVVEMWKCLDFIQYRNFTQLTRITVVFLHAQDFEY